MAAKPKCDSTLAMTGEGKSECLTPIEQALRMVGSLTLEERDEVSRRQKEKDTNCDLKQFYPHLANGMMKDLMSVEPAHGLLINHYKSKRPVLTTKLRTLILQVLLRVQT